MTDWTTEATDVIERASRMVRDRTVEPAQSHHTRRRLRRARGARRASGDHLLVIGRVSGCSSLSYQGEHVGGVAHARGNLRDRRRVLLDQSATA